MQERFLLFGGVVGDLRKLLRSSSKRDSMREMGLSSLGSGEIERTNDGSRKRDGSRAEVMENRELPEDVMRRVLSLLQLRDLFRLRCVCRQWLSLPFSLLFLDPLPPSPSSTCVFLFRLLARRANLAYSYTHKSTWVTYNVDYDRQLAGSFAFNDNDTDDDDRRSHRSSSPEFLAPSPLLEHLHTGTLEVAAAAGGLLLFGLRTQPDSLRLFVYNPATKAVRVLPPTRWAPQKLSILAGDPPSPYRILSLALHFRPNTEYRLFSFEAFDPAAATAASTGPDTWHILSHVSANLSTDELHGNTRKVMGFVNSKALWAAHGSFLYWMPTLHHYEEIGLHTRLFACRIDKGYFYRMPGLPFKTTFASMWPTSTGLQLMCGVAHQQEANTSPPPRHPRPRYIYPIPPPELHNVTMDVTLSVEIWELHQTKEQPQEELQEVYGSRDLPQGTHWQLVERMPPDLWAQLTHKKGTNGHKAACVVGPSSHNNPQVLVVADDEEEQMVIYSPLQKTWKLAPMCSKILSNLFHDVDLDHYKVLPWTISFQLSNTPV